MRYCVLCHGVGVSVGHENGVLDKAVCAVQPVLVGVGVNSTALLLRSYTSIHPFNQSFDHSIIPNTHTHHTNTMI
jgi:hypothetical protein